MHDFVKKQLEIMGLQQYQEKFEGKVIFCMFLKIGTGSEDVIVLTQIEMTTLQQIIYILSNLK